MVCTTCTCIKITDHTCILPHMSLQPVNVHGSIYTCTCTC